MPQVAAALAPIAINAAIGVGASLLANVFRPQRTTPTQTQAVRSARGLSFEVAVGEAVPVSAIWGRGRTAGQLTFAQEYGENNSWLKFKFDCGRGWHDALETVYADEVQLTLTGSNADINGLVVEQYRDAGGTPRMWVKWYNGAPGQAADAGLVAAAPTRWGANHKSTATPYVIVTLNYEEDLFSTGSLPQFGFVWRGLRQYDWRYDSTMPGGSGAQRWDDQSTWSWSENPAVLAWNFRRGHWRNGVKLMGMGYSRYANDLAYFTAAANLADEGVYFPDTGATLARYAFGREISDDEEHLSVLREMEESWCGASFDRGGAYAPVPAASVVPVLTLEDYHRVEGATVSANKWGKVSSKKTKIHGTYAAISERFVATPYGARIDVDLEALTRGPKAQAFDQPYEHRAERAQMRAEIALRRHRFGATRTETFGPIANVLEPGDPIIRNCEWGATLMIVEEVRPLADRPGREITMTAWDNSIVPDPDAGFLALPPATGTGPVAASRTLQVPGFDIEALQRVTGGNEEPFGRATWSPIEDPNCDQVIIRVWPTALPGEVEEFAADARLATAKIVGPLRPRTAYSAIALLTRRDLRRTYPTDPAQTFTTGDFRPGDTIVQSVLDQLGSGVLAQLGGQLRRQIEVFKQYGTLLEQIDQENLVERQAMVRTMALQLDNVRASYQEAINLAVGPGSAVATALTELGVQIDDLEASFTEIIEAQLGPTGAVTTRLDSLFASQGGNTAAVNIRWQASAGTSGFASRLSLQAAVDDGVFRSATQFLDVPTNPSEPTRIGFIAGQTVFFTSAGVALAVVDETGHLRSANGAIDINLLTGDLVSIGNFSFG